MAERDLARSVRCRYLSPVFVRLTSFLDDGPPTTLDHVSAQLTYRQQVKLDEKEQQGDQKYKWVERHIGVEELFESRCILVEKGKQRIGYVLVTGEAGTGKSTLVRKLAYVWAKGEGLWEVLLVYVLLVRDLLESRYHSQGDCFHDATLATAVVC